MIKKDTTITRKTAKAHAAKKNETLGVTKKRKPAEKKVRTFETNIADIMELITDPTMVIDPKGNVMVWNRAMEGLTGVLAKKIIGKGNYEYALPFYGERRPVLADIALKSADELEKKYQHISRRGNTLVAEAYVPSLPGGGTYVYGSATVLKKPNGKPVGVMEIVCRLETK